ncbi:MAG: DUF4259 domain-containing protein [Candidatus Sumerlaeota bacterium]
MGTWDFGPFDNDDASDWLFALEECDDLSVLSAALQAVNNIGGGYLEAAEGSNAIAAAEVVAALRGQPMENLPENAAAWVSENRKLDASSLVATSQSAITRIRTNSELKELFEESGEAEKWYKTLDDLSSRLARC